ncbi:MAG: hypothetical protein VX589_20975 [Myxococcota bacterium]|nr:hypothetical protein [Myxococcota bacterium]
MKLALRQANTLIACLAMAGFGCSSSSSGSSATPTDTMPTAGASAASAGFGGAANPTSPATTDASGGNSSDASSNTPGQDGTEPAGGQGNSADQAASGNAGGTTSGSAAGQAATGGQVNTAGETSNESETSMGGSGEGGRPASVGGQMNMGDQGSAGGQARGGSQAQPGGQPDMGGQADDDEQSSMGGQAADDGQNNMGGQADENDQSDMGGMVTPEFEPTEACIEPMAGQEDSCDEAFQACNLLPNADSAQCVYDMRVNVFRLSRVTVSQPEASAQVIGGALTQALDTYAQNLLIEPGGYFDTGYRWYVGNARRYTATGTYDYFKTLDDTNLYPIQNFDGVWRASDDVDPHWTLETNTGFVLNIPTNRTATVNDEEVTCFTTFTVDVTLKMTPKFEDGTMTPYMDIVISGILRQADIMDVSIPTDLGEIPLLTVIDAGGRGEPTIDTTGDGVPDAYPFVLTGSAEKVQPDESFDFPAADGSNRSPEARDNPMECDEG